MAASYRFVAVNCTVEVQGKILYPRFSVVHPGPAVPAFFMLL